MMGGLGDNGIYFQTKTWRAEDEKRSSDIGRSEMKRVGRGMESLQRDGGDQCFSEHGNLLS